jgi:hypothetical protein
MRQLLVGLGVFCFFAAAYPNLVLASPDGSLGPSVTGPNCTAPRHTISADDQKKCKEYDAVHRDVLRHPPHDHTPAYIKRQIQHDNDNKW